MHMAGAVPVNNNEDTTMNAHVEAVANANSELTNYCLPTIKALNEAVMMGPPEFIGAGVVEKRGFDAGWKAAMDAVYNRMQATIAAQRALELRDAA